MLSIDAEPLPTTPDDNPIKQNESSREESEFFDAGILYFEKDYEKVINLMDYLVEKVVFENGEKPRIDLFDIISPDSCTSSQIETLIQKCSCIIIFLTSAFLTDHTSIFKSNEILMNSVNKGTSSKNWQLLLLANEPLELPVGMKSLCVTKLYINQDLALRKLKMILQNAQKIRKIKEKQFEKIKRDVPDFFKAHSISMNSLSPEITNKPVTITFNVNAENVQIGDYSSMHGVPYSDVSKRDQIQSPHVDVLQPKLLQYVRTGEGGECVSDISGTNLQISAPLVTSTQPEADATSDTLK